jgi:hypothetical protein
MYTVLEASRLGASGRNPINHSFIHLLIHVLGTEFNSIS